MCTYCKVPQCTCKCPKEDLHPPHFDSDFVECEACRHEINGRMAGVFWTRTYEVFDKRPPS